MAILGTLTTTKDSYFFYDSGYGSYKIINGTVFFSYNTDTIEGEFNGYNIRPPKLYWKGKALYYVQPNTGAVLKRKEHYFTWSKWSAPNLSRTQETYGQRSKWREMCITGSFAKIWLQQILIN